MKLIIDINDEVYEAYKKWHKHSLIANGIPYKERPQGEWIEEIIEELESRKDYGAEYAQAMEDVIVILNAKFGVDMGGE